MTHNEIFVELTSVLSLNQSTIINIFNLADYGLTKTELNGLLKREDQEGFIEIPSNVLSLFLDGLIIHKRGKLENSPPPPKNVKYLSYNDVLKKVRIAFKLREDDLMAILKLADFKMSRSEVNALFRKEGHKNFQECGNQFLRNFLRGLYRYCK